MWVVGEQILRLEGLHVLVSLVVLGSRTVLASTGVRDSASRAWTSVVVRVLLVADVGQLLARDLLARCLLLVLRCLGVKWNTASKGGPSKQLRLGRVFLRLSNRKYG